MNRIEHRREERENKKDLKKFANEVKKLSISQLKMIDRLAEDKANKLLDTFKDLITESITQSMRENHISLDRANRVIKRANEIMKMQVGE